jgi:hypothetical protein
LARDVLSRPGRARAASLTAAHRGTAKPAVRRWPEGYDKGAHDDEGSQSELSVPAKRHTVVKRGAAQANGGPGLKGTVERKIPKLGLGSGRIGAG